MSVWLTIPSARPIEEAEKCLKLWRKQGYRIALWRDEKRGYFWDAPGNRGSIIMGGVPYPGYAEAVNRLVDVVMEEDLDAEWFVIGGDDTDPDMNYTAEEIAEQCRHHFEDVNGGNAKLETYGVMQPTGDRFAQGSIDKIAGSAWIGREFARRMYGGNGPLWPEYTRFFMDQELQDVATQYGVFQQRSDLIHLHRHYMRSSDELNAGAVMTKVPKHLAHQEGKWDAEKKIYLARKNARPTPFPGSEPIA